MGANGWNVLMEEAKYRGKGEWGAKIIKERAGEGRQQGKSKERKR